MKPRIRTLKPEIWADEKISALSRDARALLVGLITMADDEGRFRARRSTIVGHVFPDDDDAGGELDGWISEIKQKGTILFYIVDKTPYGAFRNWAKHQKINRPTPSDLPPPPNRKVVKENGLIAAGKGWRQAYPVLTDGSGNHHGKLSGDSVRPHYPARGRAFRSDPDPILIRSLCERLGVCVTRNDPKAQPAVDSVRWFTDMRLLLADRDGDSAEVERIIDWCQADSFWRSNILSPGKLRAQFTQLLLKAQAPATRLAAVPRRESASDLLRAINGDAA